MSTPDLWLCFLEAHGGEPAPRLQVGTEPDAPAIELTDRARWVLAAISLPRELAPETASNERAQARLGSRLWSSGEITARIPYQHRSTIRHGLSDLRQRLQAHGLTLEDYLVIDTARGRYGVRADRLSVDVVELHALRDDPDAFDRRLDAIAGGHRRARLAAAGTHLLSEAAVRELEQAIRASAARASPAQQSPPKSPEPSPGSAPAQAPLPPGSRRRRRWLTAAGLLVVVIGVVAAVVIPPLAGGRHTTQITADGPPRTEVSGGVAHTWSNPITAGGRAGPEIFGGERVTIACRVHGFVVQDGNPWWYLIDSHPWSRHYFVTADTFYNDGRTSGSLRGSAFVDPKVAACSSLPSSLR